MGPFFSFGVGVGMYFHESLFQVIFFLNNGNQVFCKSKLQKT